MPSLADIEARRQNLDKRDTFTARIFNGLLKLACQWHVCLSGLCCLKMGSMIKSLASDPSGQCSSGAGGFGQGHLCCLVAATCLRFFAKPSEDAWWMMMHDGVMSSPGVWKTLLWSFVRRFSTDQVALVEVKATLARQSHIFDLSSAQLSIARCRVALCQRFISRVRDWTNLINFALFGLCSVVWYQLIYYLNIYCNMHT